MSNIIKQVFFLFHVSWIILGELLLYLVVQNYSSFIDRITSRLAAINILYVKLFQSVALNQNLIDDEMNNKLLRFTDNAPWNADDVDIVSLINLRNEYNLEEFTQPINTGMISLVYKTYIKETIEPIIIKIKRVNIEKKIDDAVENLMFFMNIISFIPLVNKYNLYELVQKNICIIRNQTDFSKEVTNMTTIKYNCRNLKYVKIPVVYPSVTEKYTNIIMMEYIDGVPIDKVKNDNYATFAKQVMKFFIVTTLMHGITHGDLHGGNIIFIEDGDKCQIGVIDFGNIYEIDKSYLTACLEIMTDLFILPVNVIAEKVLLTGIIEPLDVLKSLPKEHYNNIVKFGSEILENVIHSSKQMNQMQIYKCLYAFSSYLNKNKLVGLRISDNFVNSQLALAMAHGVALTLCKDDCVSILDVVINELFHIKTFTD